MEQLTDLKAILHSKRANIYYLEKCRVMQKDGRVATTTRAKYSNGTLAKNLPICTGFNAKHILPYADKYLRFIKGV